MRQGPHFPMNGVPSYPVRGVFHGVQFAWKGKPGFRKCMCEGNVKVRQAHVVLLFCIRIQSVSSSCKHLLNDATPSYHSGICIQWCLVACHLDSSHCGSPWVAMAFFASLVRARPMAQL